MSDNNQKDEIYFRVEVDTTVGSERETVIGPYTPDELNEYGEPKDTGDFEAAVWRMIDAGMTQVSKSEAEEIAGFEFT